MSVSNLEYKEIMKKIKSEDEDERRYIANLLGEIKKEEGIKPLIHLLFDTSPAVQEAAADSLIKIGTKKVVGEIIPLLRSEDASLRNIAVEILEGIGEKAIEPLSSLLQDKDHDIRKFACDILGNIGSSKAITFLIPLLNDQHINVACAAAEALGNIKNKKATQALIEALKGRKWLTYNAIEALGKIGDTRAIKPVAQFLFKDDPLISFASVKALGEIGDPEGAEYLLPLLGSDTFNKEVIKALAKIAKKNGKKKIFSFIKNKIKIDLLEKFLKDPDPEVRKSAIYLAGIIKDKKTVPLLIPLLSDNEQEQDVWEEVVKALLEINPELDYLTVELEEKIKQTLEIFLYDNDEKLRVAADRALRKLSRMVGEN